jgi:hypothetical protein
VSLSPTRRFVLKAVVVGLCAVTLCATPVVASASSSGAAGVQLAHHVGAMRNSTSVIRFFEHHRWLLRDRRFGKEAKLRLVAAHRAIAVARADAAREHARGERSARAAHRRMLARLEYSPVKAICHVFRTRCDEALLVAGCESGYRTTAQNGQYLGMFQMGTNERRLFGHGPTALAQARAAYRYFVRAGRDWSPWSCKPWY